VAKRDERLSRVADGSVPIQDSTCSSGDAYGGLDRNRVAHSQRAFFVLEEFDGEGSCHLGGRTTNTEYSSFGIVLFNAESMEAARRIMHDDPAVKNRVFRGEIYPYSISLLKAENAE